MAQEAEHELKIVVAFDFSELSELAFAEALRLVDNRPRAHLFVLSVGAPVEDHIRLDLVEKVAVLTKPAAVALMKMHLAPLTSKSAALEFIPEVTYHAQGGDAASEIIRFAARVDADMIAMGTHARGGLKRTILGSVADHVVRHAGCPVLVVRQKSHEEADDDPAEG